MFPVPEENRSVQMRFGKRNTFEKFVPVSEPPKTVLVAGKFVYHGGGVRTIASKPPDPLARVDVKDAQDRFEQGRHAIWDHLSVKRTESEYKAPHGRHHFVQKQHFTVGADLEPIFSCRRYKDQCQPLPESYLRHVVFRPPPSSTTDNSPASMSSPSNKVGEFSGLAEPRHDVLNIAAEKMTTAPFTLNVGELEVRRQVRQAKESYWKENNSSGVAAISSGASPEQGNAKQHPRLLNPLATARGATGLKKSVDDNKETATQNWSKESLFNSKSTPMRQRLELPHHQASLDLAPEFRVALGHKKGKRIMNSVPAKMSSAPSPCICDLGQDPHIHQAEHPGDVCNMKGVKKVGGEMTKQHIVAGEFGFTGPVEEDIGKKKIRDPSY